MLKKSPLKRGNSKLEKSPMKKDFSPIKGKGRLKKSGRIKSRVKSEEELIEEQLLCDKRTAFYKQCETKVGVRSAITGKYLTSPGRQNYHHVLQKSKYGDIEFSFNVILPLTLNEHSMVENDIDKFKENIEKINWVRNNYEQCQRESAKWEKEFENKLKI